MILDVPVAPAQPQRFTTTMSGTVRRLTFRWCAPFACWVMDVATQDGVEILSGIPVVTGADLLGQFAYLGLGGALVAQTDNDTPAVPTFDNFGREGHLFYLTEGEEAGLFS